MVSHGSLLADMQTSFEEYDLRRILLKHSHCYLGDTVALVDSEGSNATLVFGKFLLASH